MNTLQKKKLRGTGVNCGLIVLLFAVVLLLGQVLPDNTYRRVLVPIIWQMCIFILVGLPTAYSGISQCMHSLI